jgi:hypothetical protein
VTASRRGLACPNYRPANPTSAVSSAASLARDRLACLSQISSTTPSALGTCEHRPARDTSRTGATAGALGSPPGRLARDLTAVTHPPPGLRRCSRCRLRSKRRKCSSFIARRPFARSLRRRRRHAVEHVRCALTAARCGSNRFRHSTHRRRRTSPCFPPSIPQACDGLGSVGAVPAHPAAGRRRFRPRTGSLNRRGVAPSQAAAKGSASTPTNPAAPSSSRPAGSRRRRGRLGRRDRRDLAYFATAPSDGILPTPA